MRYRSPPYLGAYTLQDALDRVQHGISARGGVRGYSPSGPWGSYSHHQAHMNVDPGYQNWYSQHRQWYDTQPQYHQQWDYGMRPIYFPQTVQPNQTYDYYHYAPGNPYTFQPHPYQWIYTQRG